MKKLVVFLLLIISGINILIFTSGKKWLYKAFYITYLQGYKSSYINDFIHFPTNIIENGPHQSWPISKQYNKTKLPEFVNAINDSLETVALLIIKKDSIAFEEYWHGYSADTISNSFSMAKSWVSTLIGVAIRDGKIKSVNQKVSDFIPEFANRKNSEITIKHLLTMSSGLDWDEDYYNPFGKTAEAYYGENLRDLVLNLKAVDPPGIIFKYHSSCTQILAFIIEQATSQSINKYMQEKLWKPFGARNPALWSLDKKNGDEKAFCCINSNARDYARLGKLYLNNGLWNGVPIIDSSYSKEAVRAAELKNIDGYKNTNYGYQFWLAKRKNLNIFYARGLWGQYMICIPEKDIIIVRLGRKYGEKLNDGHRNDFYAYIDAALEMYP